MPRPCILKVLILADRAGFGGRSLVVMVEKDSTYIFCLVGDLSKGPMRQLRDKRVVDKWIPCTETAVVLTDCETLSARIFMLVVQENSILALSIFRFIDSVSAQNRNLFEHAPPLERIACILHKVDFHQTLWQNDNVNVALNYAAPAV